MMLSIQSWSLASADIAGPVVVQAHLQRPVRQAEGFFLVAGVQFFEEVFDQQRDVFAAFAQGRNAHREHVQAVEQVRPETPLLDRVFQVFVGRGDDPHVDLAGLRVADPFQLLFLQDAQQRGLRARGQFNDFIEEQRTAIGPLETPHARLLGTGVGAFFHAEQLRFDQVWRDGRAVQRDKGPAGPFAAQVQAPGWPSIKYTSKEGWFVTGKWEQETEVSNRAQGNAYWMKLTVPF